MARAEEWRAKAREAARAEAVELTLPSGMVILARRPAPEQLLVWGKLPLGLATAAAGETAAAQQDDSETVELAGFMCELLLYACVDPKISRTPGEGEIHPKDIPQGDWTFILNWALRAEEVRALQGFRRQQRDAGGSGDGEAVLDKTF